MRLLVGISIGFAAVATIGWSPATAQDTGSQQLGSTTISVGGGIRTMYLPEVGSFITDESGAGLLQSFEFLDKFKETGQNYSGTLETRLSPAYALALSGYWASAEDDGSIACRPSGGGFCAAMPLVDNPATQQAAGSQFGINAYTERDVQNWGVSLEGKRLLNGGSGGMFGYGQYVALGADIRAIDQELDTVLGVLQPGGGVQVGTYSETLDTRYYGAFLAWGGGYEPFLFADIWRSLGLKSSFRVQGGVYYADTDYEGLLAPGGGTAATSLSVSDNKAAFIGAITTETSKQIAPGISLSLVSTYEYYSSVPEVRYNTTDVGNANTPGTAGRQSGLAFDDDAGFTASTSLRLKFALQ